MFHYSIIISENSSSFSPVSAEDAGFCSFSGCCCSVALCCSAVFCFTSCLDFFFLSFLFFLSLDSAASELSAFCAPICCGVVSCFIFSLSPEDAFLVSSSKSVFCPASLTSGSELSKIKISLNSSVSSLTGLSCLGCVSLILPVHFLPFLLFRFRCAAVRGTHQTTE